MNNKPEADRDATTLRHFRAILINALDHASLVAARSSEAFEGTPDIFLFDAARAAIAEFATDNPAMKALASASVRDRT